MRALLALTMITAGLSAEAQMNADTESMARYKLTFEADWSAATHPSSFPSNPHFSPLIGATHNAEGYFWRLGENSSDGVEDMAETGSIVVLRNEINQLISQDSARFLIEGAGVPLSPGTTSVEFDVARTHPLLSLTTMIAPSPDWFVGVDSLPLLNDGSWLDNITVELFSIDAGTDDGSNYGSSNRNTSPAQPIVLISDGPAVNGAPIGRFVIELLSIQGQLPIEGAHSGLYFDPLRDGEGININIDMIGERHVLTAIWYTHHEGRQMWLIGVADLEPGVKCTI